jgi:hypothetical protein
MTKDNYCNGIATEQQNVGAPGSKELTAPDLRQFVRHSVARVSQLARHADDAFQKQRLLEELTLAETVAGTRSVFLVQRQAIEITRVAQELDITLEMAAERADRTSGPTFERMSLKADMWELMVGKSQRYKYPLPEAMVTEMKDILAKNEEIEGSRNTARRLNSVGISAEDVKG